MRWLVILGFILLTAGKALPQPAAQPGDKVDELIRLLDDPEVRTWIEGRRAERPPEESAQSHSKITEWEADTRQRIRASLAAIPRIPSEFISAAERVRADAVSHGYAPVLVIAGGLVAIGLVAEWLFRKTQRRSEDLLFNLASTGVFTVTMMTVFFLIEWPPLARITLLVYLSAFVFYRVAAALVGSMADGRLRVRLRLMLAILSFAVASAVLGPHLGIDPPVTKAISYAFSIILLGLSIEALWSMLKSTVVKAALTAFAIAVWLLWCFNLKTMFWLALYILALPPILRRTGRLVAFASADAPYGLRYVLISRGTRAAVVLIATGWLALVWQMNPDGPGHRDPFVVALFYGLLKSVVVVLFADLLWQLTKSWINRTLAPPLEGQNAAVQEPPRQARMRTLLPILRNGIAVLVLVMTALIVLAELGIEIGPLIAGAGIFGVAIGFGSQTLVKDVISGVFYMLDDAFRVGEYIQAKSYKGTVEGFSLRSVRLRHHRGPIFTVPFGELGAVENMSRDWGVVKFRISVTYDADLEKARKLTKKVGATLMEDPEFGPLFIEPLKMKGLEEFGDYGVVLSFGMTLRPSPFQSAIRRRANLMIREAFRDNDIDFAIPSVQVGGEDREAAAAATALKIQHTKASAAAISP